MKKCRKCQVDKPLSDFRIIQRPRIVNKVKTGEFYDYQKTICYDCELLDTKERAKENRVTYQKKRRSMLEAWQRNGYASKEAYDKYQREYYEKNKAQIAQRKKDDKWAGRLKNAKKRAKEKGWEFNLTREHLDSIYVPFCPILGIELSYGGTSRIVSESATIDRIDNTKGYIIGNVQILSHKANRMKSDASPDELRSFAQYILQTLG